jgi:hypothetical protein
VQIAASDHHIADMNADSKFETVPLRNVVISLRKGMLYLYGALNGIYSTWELGQDTVASGVGNSSALLGYQPVNDLAMSSQDVERPNLIQVHQARVACHIRREDCYQPPLDPVLLRTHGTLGAVPDRILLWAG